MKHRDTARSVPVNHWSLHFNYLFFNENNFSISIQLVTTYHFEPVGTDSTLFKVSVHAAGEVEEGLPAIVEGVWEHFILEQLEPYIKSRKHIEKEWYQFCF